VSGVSNAFQTLIFQRLTTFAPLVALIGTRVYDQPAAGAVAPYITFGPSDVVPQDVDCIDGRIETLQLDVWSEAQDGKRECKAICDAVRAALHRFAAEPVTGALVEMEIELTRVLDDPDGRTSHGVVQVRAMLEEVGI